MPEVTQEVLNMCQNADSEYCKHVEDCGACEQGMIYALSHRPQKPSGNNDKINGVFQAAGGAFIVLSILQCWHDKSVAGVSLYHVGFFAAWGYWNLYYYKAIQQRFSFLASIGVTVANTVWLALLIYYKLF